MKDDNTGLRAGASRVEILLPNGFFPYSSFNRRYFTGVHDSIYVRVLLLETKDTSAMVVSVDTGDLSGEWLPALSRIAGVPQSHIFLTATHTHEAPYFSRTIPEDVVDAHKTQLAKQSCWSALEQAVFEAKRAMRPAIMQYGCGHCYVNVNRNVLEHDHYVTGKNFTGYSDRTMFVLQIAGEDGNPIALVTNYAVHSSALLFSNTGGDGMLISGDLAGSAMRMVEQALGEKTVAMFTMSAAADQDPRMKATWREIREGKMNFYDAGMAGYAIVDAMASEMCDEILRVIHEELTPPVQHVQISGGTTAVTVDTKEKKAPPKPGEGPPQPDDPNKPFVKNGIMDVQVSLLCLNELAIVGIGGEIVTSIGRSLRQAMLAHGYSAAFVATQCNGSVSYISDEEGYQKRTFDATDSYCMPGVAAQLVAGATALAVSSHNQD